MWKAKVKIRKQIQERVQAEIQNRRRAPRFKYTRMEGQGEVDLRGDESGQDRKDRKDRKCEREGTTK